MALVKYAQYRAYEEQRIRTNDTMMGLLAGSRLASQMLSLTEGSKLRLSEIFPAVQHVDRFDLKTDRARKILDDAENLLGILAVPQVVALHEDLLKGMMHILAPHHGISKKLLGELKASNVHEEFEKFSPGSFTVESVELFHLVRVARNTHIHSGGVADSRLLNRFADTSTKAFQVWEAIIGTAFPQYDLGDPVRLGVTELVGILAITRRLADEANRQLQIALPRNGWMDVLLDDWRDSRRPGNPDQVLRQITGLARSKYGPLKLAEVEIEAAAKKRGLLK